MRDFANVLKGKSRAEQMGLAAFAGIDLKTLEALQSGDIANRMAEHSATLKKLGVNEDEAAAKANALQVALAKLNDTLAGIGTLLLDRFGPSLTQFFEKLNAFIVDNADKIVLFFEKLGKVAGELAVIFQKVLDVVGPLWEEFDNLTQSIAGTDGLTAALVALIGLKVGAWLIGVAAAIAKVGTAASVALLGGALGKFLALFGIGAAVAVAMNPTAANAGEDQEIARRRAAGTWGPASPADLAADAEKRSPGRREDNSLWGRVKRGWQARPSWLGGESDPAKGASIAPKGNAAKLAAAREAYDFWRSKGASHEVASGLVANEEAESAFNPNARGDGGRAHGLFQHHPDRRAHILAGAGIDMSTANAQKQREGAYWEMTQSPARENRVWNALNETKTAGEAGAFVSRRYERPLAESAEASKRAAAANGWAQRFAQQQSKASEPATASIPVDTSKMPDPKDAEAYKAATGRDLAEDLKSDDRHVRRWAAGARDNLRVKRGEERLGTGDEADAKAQAEVNKANEGPKVSKEDAEAYKRSMGRDINADLHSDNPQAREWAQTVLGYFDDKRKADLARADDNASKTADAGSGGSSPALAPPPASTTGTSVTIDQKNEIHVTGSGDPHDTAQQIGQSQRDVNGGLVRDLKGAVR